MQASKEVKIAVRQILADDLGVSREEIRKVTNEFVAETVDAHIKKMFDEGIITTMATAAFNKYMGREVRSFNSIEFILQQEVKKQVSEFLSKNLRISLDKMLS